MHLLYRLFLEIFFPVRAYAATTTPPGGAGGTNPPPATNLTLTDPLEGATFDSILASITTGITTLAVPLAVIMILYGGIQLMIAGGDAERAKSGKDAIFYAVVGLGVVLAANGIVAILREILGA